MRPPGSLGSLPPEGAECRGSKPACAGLDGTRDSGLWPLALSTFKTAARY